MNPQPRIIRTQGHNNKKFGKMNLYEAFQQTVSVPQKKKGTKLVHYKCRNVANVETEGSGSQTVVVMMNREKERERAPKMKIENESFLFFQFLPSPNPPNFPIKI